MPVVLTMLCYVLLLCLAADQIPGEKYTALKDMELVLQAESAVAQDLWEYIAAEEARLQELSQLAGDFERHSSEALANPDHHLGNPLNAFLLVKRFTTDWDHLVGRLLRSEASEEFLADISDKTDLFPTMDDLDGSIDALMRLQDTYALPTSKIATGELQGIQKSRSLTAGDCFALGRYAYNKEDYYHTVLWMREALERYDVEDIKSVNKIDLLDYLSFAAAMQGNTRYAYNLTIELLQLEPDHVRGQRNARYYEKVLAEQAEEDREREEELRNPKTYPDEYRASEQFQNYERLCRGEDTVYRPVEHKLYCRYSRHHPIFYIRPLKEEVMNFDPQIVVFHDVLNNEEIELIKKLATPRLQRATVAVNNNGSYAPANYRTSKSAWLRDEEHFLINRVSQRSAALSNLTLDTVEELQVVNYGIGGHYEPHFDYASDGDLDYGTWRGNRIATVIYYMSDVEAGGYTVFNDIGVKLTPEKGSCALWYNLMRNGVGDTLVKHAGCPVLVGNKWVSNKWFHERAQEFVRPCTLFPEE